MSQERWERVKLILFRMVQKDMRRKKHREIAKRLWSKHRVTRTLPQDWTIVKGDLVEVIRGRDEGKQGKVLRVYRRGETVVVDGINLRLHKTRGSEGEMVTEFKPSKILVYFMREGKCRTQRFLYEISSRRFC